MPVINSGGGRMSVRNVKQGDRVVTMSSPSARRRGGGGSRNMTTKQNPTPSANQLYGSAEQREKQIQAFRSGGQEALNAAVEQAKQAELQKQNQQIQLSQQTLRGMELQKQHSRIPTKSTTTPEHEAALRQNKVQALGGYGTKAVKFVKEEVIGGKTFYKTFPKIAEAEAKRNQEAETQYLHEKMPPLKLFDKASELIVGGSELIGGKIPPEQRKQTIRGVSNILKIGAFSPLMSTGTAQESEYVEVRDAQGRIVGYAEKEKAAEAARKVLANFDDAYKTGGQEGVIRNLGKFISKVKDKKGVENLLKNLADKGYIKGYAVDTTTGNFMIEGASSTATKVINVELDFSTLNTAPRMKYLGETISGTTTIQPQGRFENIELGQNIMEVGVNQEQKPQKDNILKVKTANLLGSKSGSKTTQEQKPVVETATTPTTTQIIKPSTATSTLLGLSQLNRLDTATRQVTKNIQQYKQKPKLFLTPKLSSGLTVKEQMIKVGKGLFEAFSKKGGKLFKIGAFKTQAEAESKLKKVLTGSLRASGWVEKSGEKVKPLSFGSMFRPSKRDKDIIVEKRRFRLDQPSETREIQFFKKSSPSINLFSKTKPKKKIKFL